MATVSSAVKVSIPGLTLSHKCVNHDKAGFFDDSGAVTRKLIRSLAGLKA